jgi:hypothetical protein
MDVRVYAAYWLPGHLDPTQVTNHTPDICWVSEGGTIVERDDGRMLPGYGNIVFRPASFRVFEFPRGREEVVFWYGLGGKTIQFADLETSPLIGRLRRFGQTLQLTLSGLAAQEQIFVRISTNRTIDEVIRSDLWPGLTSTLRRSGIVEQAH